MSTSLLLERTGSLLESLYKLLPDPRPKSLFDNTELAAHREQGPLWLDASDNAILLDAVNKQPERWPGLVIESPAPDDTLLAHLRHLLIVNFDGARRGVLRYSNPVTASYFFTSDSDHPNASWLGPISRLSWYGGTWADIAQNNQRWLHLDNPHAAQWTPPAPPNPPRLSPAHEQALGRQEQERFAFEWWKRQTGTSFPQALDYLDEGMVHGFAEAPSLMNRYLTLRAQHPVSQPPTFRLNSHGEQRLHALQKLLQTICTESTQ